MAGPRLSLPSGAELRAFAQVAAPLLAQRMAAQHGQRAVARRAGAGLEVLDHRDYQAGDAIRHIDWRLSARLGRAMVRRFEAESSADWWLLLDLSSSMATGEARKWRAAARLVAGLSYALLQVGHRVGLLGVDRGVRALCPLGRGALQYARVVRSLREAEPHPRGETCDWALAARAIRGGAALVVLSDALVAPGDLHRDLAALLSRCREMQLLQLVDAADAHPAARGACDVVDVESGQYRHLWLDEAACAAAVQAQGALTQQLRAYCRRSGIAHSTCDPDMPWQRALLRHLERLPC